jgi:hypothetical protein
MPTPHKAPFPTVNDNIRDSFMQRNVELTLVKVYKKFTLRVFLISISLGQVTICFALVFRQQSINTFFFNSEDKQYAGDALCLKCYV